jgi:quercetin dioxygenase-like cupin family protein
MKAIRMGMVAAAIAAAAGTAWAASSDPLEVGAHVYKKRFENERVRVMEVAFKPGDKIDMHSHPDHVNYLISGGTLRLSYPDGTSKEIAAPTGEVIWIPAESHAAENVGDTEVRILVTELKAGGEAAAA